MAGVRTEGAADEEFIYDETEGLSCSEDEFFPETGLEAIDDSALNDYCSVTEADNGKTPND